MAAVHPHTMAIVSTSAFHDVIGVVCLGYFIVWIYYDLREGEHEQVRADCERPALVAAVCTESHSLFGQNVENVTWKM